MVNLGVQWRCMRIKYLPVFVLSLLLVSNLSFAADQQHVTGKDWLLMSQPDKVTYISSAIDVLQRRGIMLSKSPNDYIAAIDHLSDDPKMLSVDATNILASYVYDTEPMARKAIDILRKKPEVKKIEMH